jgi:hypothetical protein
VLLTGLLLQLSWLALQWRQQRWRLLNQAGDTHDQLGSMDVGAVPVMAAGELSDVFTGSAGERHSK